MSVTFLRSGALLLARILIVTTVVVSGCAGFSAPAQAGVEYSGQFTIHGTADRIVGAPSEEVAQLLSSSRSGTEFHVLLSGMPAELLEIELGFAELAAIQPGQRVFDLDINDKRALNSFDIAETAGGVNRAVIRRFTITPKRGFLDFHFSGLTGEASVNYIRVRGRGFINTVAATGESATPTAVEDPDALPTNLPSYNSDTGEVLQDEMSPTWPSGFPLGGIGTGKLEILPSGEFANLTINNSWDLPVGRVPGTFIAIGTKATSGNGQGKLLRVHASGSTSGNYLNAKTFLSCVFRGIFPIAEWDFKDDKIPVEVKLEGWSPLVPQNVGDSSLPAAVLYVHLRNPRSYPISAGVALSWEDVNGRGGSRNRTDQFGYAGSAIFSDAATSTIQGVLIRSTAPAEGRRGTFIGDYFIGTPVKRAVVTRQLYWDPHSAEIPWWRQFLNKMRLEKVGPVPSSIAPGVATLRGASRGPGAAVICASVNLAPKERRRIPFIISWYVPKLSTIESATMPGTTEQQDYATTFGSSLGVASYVASNRVRLQQGTTDWQSMILRSNLPMSLKSHVLNSLSTIVSNSILLQGRRFSMLESPGEMGGMMGALDHRLVAQPFLMSMYPSLDRTELELYGRAQNESGHLPRYIGNIHGGWTGLDPKLLGEDWTDPSAAWVMQSAAHYRVTGDREFVDHIRPALDKTVRYLEQMEASTTVTASGRSFFDDVSPSGSDVSFTKVNNAAAFGAAAAVYNSLGDSAGAGRATKDFAAARTAAMVALQPFSASIGTSATFAAALAGDWASRAAGLQPVVGDQVVSAATNMIKVRHVDAYKPMYPAEVNADGSLVKGLSSFAGLLQSFFGAEAIWFGDVDVGMEAFARAQEIATRVQSSPWRQALMETVPEGVKPRLRSHMSSPSGWNVLPALSGVALDLPGKILYLDPKVPGVLADREMTIPVFTPAFWAWLDYDANDSTGTLAITKVFPGYEGIEIERVVQRQSADGKPVNERVLQPKFKLSEGQLLRLSGWPMRAGGKITAEMPSLATEEQSTTTTLNEDEEATTTLKRDSLSTETLNSDTDTSDTMSSGTMYGP